MNTNIKNYYKVKSLEKLKSIFISKDFILFLLIGILNMANGIVFALVYSILFNTNIAFILGFGTSLTIAYFLNNFIIFKKRIAFVTYFKFILANIPNFIIQNIVVIIFFDILSLNKLLVYSLASVISVPITFVFLKFFTFKKDWAMLFSNTQSFCLLFSSVDSANQSIKWCSIDIFWNSNTKVSLSIAIFNLNVSCSLWVRTGS